MLCAIIQKPLNQPSVRDVENNGKVENILSRFLQASFSVLKFFIKYPEKQIEEYAMIQVEKMDGTEITLNADWIQTIESTPDTVITLTTGLKLLVKQSSEAIVDACVAYKRKIHTEEKK